MDKISGFILYFICHQLAQMGLNANFIDRIIEIYFRGYLSSYYSYFNHF